MIEIVKILVDAGATPVSAAKAASILEAGGSVREAHAVIEFAPVPATFDAQLLLGALERPRDRVEVRRG